MGQRLSDAAVRQYHEQGYHFPVSVLSPEEAADYRTRVEAVEARHGPVFQDTFKEKPHLLFPFLAELVRHPAILDAVEDVLGPDVLCVASSFFTKEARAPHYVGWHQDGEYWGLGATEVATAWVALAPSTVANGCMRVIPGTHTTHAEHSTTYAPHNMLARGQEIDLNGREADAVDLVLAPGEMSLHHILLWHGSGPNQTDERRMGFAIRYVAAHVPPLADSVFRDAVLVRGADRHGHYELYPAPQSELDPAMLPLYERMQNHRRGKIARETDGRGK